MRIIFPWDLDDEAVEGTSGGDDHLDSSLAVDEAFEDFTGGREGLDASGKTVEAAKRLAKDSPGSIAEFVEGLDTLASATGRSPSELADVLEQDHSREKAE